MAQPRNTQQTQASAGAPGSRPRVHPPGRLAGSVSPSRPGAEPASGGSPSLTPVTEPAGSEPREPPQDRPGSVAAGPDSDGDGSGEQEAPEQDSEPREQQRRFDRQLHRTRQRERRQLLDQCDRLLLLDFNSLAMPDWPDHYTVEKARRQRDLWVFVLSLVSLVVLLGLISLVPALVAGAAFGLGVLLLALGLPPVRHLITDNPSYAELLMKRQRLMRQARNHIRHVEGPLGLAACCRALGPYNPALTRARFQRLYELSRQGRLATLVHTRGHCQLYLMFALEAEKAYNRLQDEYLKAHQEEIDAGEAQPLNVRETSHLSESSGGEAAERPDPDAPATGTPGGDRTAS
ncbi:MAG: hypothetical protein R3296_11960 [Oleiphilaceae bacterium]|nr:hypothetical protein [Oleiphilaceae bacterium]